jgi:release factor glutamine methyltransferase
MALPSPKTCVASDLFTAGSCLQGAVERLKAHRVSESRLKAEWILSRVLKCRRLELPLQRDFELSDVQLRQFAGMVQRVAEGEPIQYVLGDTEFMGRALKTDARALIPRPETEMLAETALACQEVWRWPHPDVVDVGTGSGCVIVTLAVEKPHGEYVAIDADAEALELARENAAALGVKRNIKFLRNDLLKGLPRQSFDLVVSNPPYVSTAEWDALQPEIRDHEPRLALDGGSDGLDVISKLVPQAFNNLKPGGWLFMEIGEDQGERVKTLLQNHGFEQVDIRKDLAGHDRMACGGKPR